VRNVTMRITVTVAGLLFFGSLVSATPPAAAQSATRVSGTWQTIIPASLTSYHPSAGDPTTGTYTGVGTTLWRGTWTGVTEYKIQGTANLITAAGSGTLQETFVGRAAGGGRGTLRFVETYTLDETGHVEIRCKITGGSGAFAGSRGSATFVGTELSVATGHGSYSGLWQRSM
jgi:hypothetical protein